MLVASLHENVLYIVYGSIVSFFFKETFTRDLYWKIYLRCEFEKKRKINYNDMAFTFYDQN